MSEALEQKLEANSKQEAAEARRIAEHVQAAIEQTRMLARGLSPVERESADLPGALTELASNTEQMFRIRCAFVAGDPIGEVNDAVSTHLYRIAQEAISNAIRHGSANKVTILLEAEGCEAILSVSDNGSGFAAPKKDHRGMGLRIMQYRAGMIGGSLEIARGNGKGAVVSCRFRPAMASLV
jgi:two-component system CheB/CheR fusion protein